MKLLYIFVIGLSVIIAPLAVWAQSMDFDIENKGFSNLRQAGKLVTLEVIPKGKEIHLKVVGNSAAKVKIDDLSLEATYGLGQTKKRVTLTRKANGFILKRDQLKPMDLQIRVMTSEEAENFNFKLK